MSDEVITSFDQVTSEWLTHVLAQSGALENGSVESFAVQDTDQRLLSTNAKLILRYTENAQGAMPKNLFLKTVNVDQGDEFFGPSEVNYYVRDYVGVDGVPLPRTYDAAYSKVLGRYHILMDDLSTTHVMACAKTPTLEYGLALAEGLAAMHAHWWGQERLAAGGEPIHSPEVIRRFVDIAQPGAGHILDNCADELQAHWPDLIWELYEKHPAAMINRMADGNGFTLIHGDPNCTNILVPKDAEFPIYILDRQPFDWSLTTWLGVYDLVYSMVLDSDVETRRVLEKPVLEHYHDHLIKRGVQDYSWEQLWDDYRLSIPIGVYVGTEWCRGHYNADGYSRWMAILERSLTAIDDLKCDDLW
ncbi:MAG: hypothetical protein ABI690_08260 [Chloroflexota bacterium]